MEEKILNELTRKKIEEECENIIRYSKNKTKSKSFFVKMPMIDDEDEIMTDKILNETTTFCETCSKRECCPEEECILYRIEQIVTSDVSNKKV